MLNVIQLSDMQIPETPEAWLSTFSTTSAIEIRNPESDRWRVVCTLVHGNEPSGFIAAHKFLQENPQPYTNLAIVVASVRAAKHEPIFTHRQIPGEFDLNRRFGQQECHDTVSETARDIFNYINSLSPQYTIDLHNTSGNGPAFAVSVNDQDQAKKLARLFTDKMVVTHLVVGSLMEQNFNCPVVTIECGGARQASSHALAYEGLKAFAQVKDLEDLKIEHFPCFYHPSRVELHQGISIEYGSALDDEVDLTLREDIESLNEGVVDAHTLIGWIQRDAEECLTVRNEHGEDSVNSFFYVENNELRAKEALQIFMATNRADIARSDCIFYAVEN